jgi:hypothetical protein
MEQAVFPYIFRAVNLQNIQSSSDFGRHMQTFIIQIEIITGGFIMSLKTLAEAIILQSGEDYMDERHRAEAVEFLSGEGFRLCSGLAQMDHASQCAFLNLLKPYTKRRVKQLAIPKPATRQEPVNNGLQCQITL